MKNANPAVFEQGAASEQSDITFRNNIFINMGSGAFNAPLGCTFDGNLYFGNGYIAADARRILADPKLVYAGGTGNGMAAADAYKLTTGSPALDAGGVIPANGGLDFWGNPVSAVASPHLGAFNGAPVPQNGVYWDADTSLAGAQDGSGTWTLSGANTYAGNTTVKAGALRLASTGSLFFQPAANAVGNQVATTGSGTAYLNGAFFIDLTAADATARNTWHLVDKGTAGAVVYGETFSVWSGAGGFAETAPGSGIWKRQDGLLTWTFTESSGDLSLENT